MLLKLSTIIIFCLIALVCGMLLYSPYIKLLKKYKMGKNIRESSVTGDGAPIFASLHQHKKNTPTMGGALILLTVACMIGVSVLLQYIGYIENSLISQRETFLLLIGFFGMGGIGLIDDIFNIRSIGRIKGLSAKAKTIGMIVFAGAISYRFFAKLGVDYLYIRPLNLLWNGSEVISLGRLFPVLSFFFIITLVNAINITDGLDGLAGGIMSMILLVLVIPAFVDQAYITSTLIGIVIASLLAFMRYNISPARIFMGDSGAFALGGLLSTLVLTLNMRGVSILIPFLIIFSICIIEIGSSFLQIIRKSYRGRKLFPIAPFHHLLEYKGMSEPSIVMKLRFIQAILCTIGLLMLIYQL